MVLSSKEDVMIPYPKNKSLPFTKKELQRFKSNVQNSLKNAVAYVSTYKPVFLFN